MDVVSRFRKLAGFLLFFAIFRMPAYAETGCEGVFLDSIPQPSSSISVSASLDGVHSAQDGSLYFDINYINGSRNEKRRVFLPSAVPVLRELAPEFLIVLAGNSGEPYQNTRHNLAQFFGDRLLGDTSFISSQRQLEGQASSPHLESDSIVIGYDDGTSQVWNTTFKTEKPTFRTSSMEIFYLPELAGHRVVVLKAIGDYNEVGDAAIPLMEALGLQPHQLILVHDDADLPPGEVRSFRGKPVAYAGNNATYSLIRNLAYRIASPLEKLFHEMPYFNAAQDQKAIEELKAELIHRADVRYSGHLGASSSQDLFHQAFKNRNTILNPILSFLKTYRKTKLASETDSIRKQLAPEIATYEQEEKAITSTFRGAPTAEQKSALQHVRAKKQEVLAPIKARETEIQNAIDALTYRIELLVDQELSYSRLALGIGRPADGDMASFVLGPIPAELQSTESYWLALEALLRMQVVVGTRQNAAATSVLFPPVESAASAYLSKSAQDIEQKMLELRQRIVDGNLTNTEKLQRTKEISELIIPELKRQGITGVAFQYPGNGRDPIHHTWAVNIVGIEDRSARHTKVLLRGYEKLNARFFFIPYLQARDGITGARMEDGLGLALPIESILEGNVGTSGTILHELRHHKFRRDLINGKPNPYYGEFLSSDEEISNQGYAKFLSFEELSTWDRGLKHARAGVPVLTPFGRDRSLLSSPKKAMRILAEGLREMSIRVKQYVEVSRSMTYEGRVRFDLDRNVGRITATIPFEEFPGRTSGTIKYWLIESQSPSDPRNYMLLRNYLNEVEAAADYHLSEANKALRGP